MSAIRAFPGQHKGGAQLGVEPLNEWAAQDSGHRRRSTGSAIHEPHRASARQGLPREPLVSSAEHVVRAIRDFRDSLATGEGTNDAVRAKEALANHLGKLVLTPATRDGRQVYRVTGNVTLPDGDGCRMQVVARDGIEPYSGIDST